MMNSLEVMDMATTPVTALPPQAPAPLAAWGTAGEVHEA